RFLYDASGRVRVRRLIPVVGTCVAFAVFGSFLLVLTPMLSDNEGVRTLWVLFSIFLLKFPLIALLSWFILRHFEWPVKPPKWSDREAREILDYLLAEAGRVQGMPDGPARLAYLQREAWNVADRMGGELKADAVDVAVRIDGLAARRRA